MRGHKWLAITSIGLILAVTYEAATAPADVSRQAAAPAQPPTFRSAVKLIDIDVFVTDEDGAFVKDLTRDDFEIIEDGKPQSLETFAFVDLPIVPPPAEPQRELVDSDVTTNTDAQGRLYAIVMDSPSTASPPSWVSGVTYTVLTRRVASRFIDEFMQPGDLAGVIHAHGTFSDGQFFTASRHLLRTSVERFGRGLSGDLDSQNNGISGAERVQRHLVTYRTLQDVAERLGAITGRRKAILWFGAQLRYEIPTCPSGLGLDNVECQLQSRWGAVQQAHRDAMTAATRNNVAIYAIDPAGLTTATGGPEMDRRAALQIIAEDSGGLSIVGTNNFSLGFQNIVRDNSTYYVLGYAPAQEYRDGKFHRVDVRVKRPGRYTVRTRRGYVAQDARVAAAAAPPRGSSDVTRQALRLPIPVAGLALSFFAAPLREAGRDQSVVIGGRIGGALLLEGKQDITLSYQVFTVDNRVQAGEFEAFGLTLRPQSRARAMTDGVHFVDRLLLPPGRYQIRYVVDQPGGAVGSVVAPLLVPKFDDGLSLSGIVLLATAGRFMVRDDPEVRERVGGIPTSARRFRDADVLRAYVEVYSEDARLVAEDLTVRAVLSTPDGEEVRSELAHLSPGAKSTGWPFSVQLALSGVPAGNYVLTMTASSTRQEDVVYRQVPVVVDE